MKCDGLKFGDIIIDDEGCEVFFLCPMSLTGFHGVLVMIQKPEIKNFTQGDICDSFFLKDHEWRKVPLSPFPKYRRFEPDDINQLKNKWIQYNGPRSLTFEVTGYKIESQELYIWNTIECCWNSSDCLLRSYMFPDSKKPVGVEF